MDLYQTIFVALAMLFLAVYGGYYLLCIFVARSRRLKIERSEDSKDYEPNISIIIPTWNEESCIKGKLENTLSLRYPNSKREIIVIDSNSDDGTVEIVRKFMKKFGKKGIRLIVEKRRSGKASALNRAFGLCKGEIVAITDADSRLERDCLMKTAKYFSDSSIGAITARERIINQNENAVTKMEKSYRDLYYLIRHTESILDSTFIFDGPFCAFRRKCIERLYADSTADDTEMALRIRRKGFRTLSVPDIHYLEYAASKLSDRTKQKYRRAQGLIQMMVRFFSTFFANPSYGLFGLLIFPVEFFMHVISPFMLLAIAVMLIFLPPNVALALLALLLIAILIPKTRLTVFTFLHTQYACLKGILSYTLRGPNHLWEQVRGTRRYGR